MALLENLVRLRQLDTPEVSGYVVQIIEQYLQSGTISGIAANTGVLTGVFYPYSENPSGYVTSGQTGAILVTIAGNNLSILTTVANNYYPLSNPSGFLNTDNISGRFIQGTGFPNKTPLLLYDPQNNVKVFDYVTGQYFYLRSLDGTASIALNYSNSPNYVSGFNIIATGLTTPTINGQPTITSGYVKSTYVPWSMFNDAGLPSFNYIAATDDTKNGTFFFDSGNSFYLQGNDSSNPSRISELDLYASNSAINNVPPFRPYMLGIDIYADKIQISGYNVLSQYDLSTGKWINFSQLTGTSGVLNDAIYILGYNLNDTGSYLYNLITGITGATGNSVTIQVTGSGILNPNFSGISGIKVLTSGNLVLIDGSQIQNQLYNINTGISGIMSWTGVTLGSFVTTNTIQTISGQKTFTTGIYAPAILNTGDYGYVDIFNKGLYADGTNHSILSFDWQNGVLYSLTGAYPTETSVPVIDLTNRILEGDTWQTNYPFLVNNYPVITTNGTGDFAGQSKANIFTKQNTFLNTVVLGAINGIQFSGLLTSIIDRGGNTVFMPNERVLVDSFNNNAIFFQKDFRNLVDNSGTQTSLDWERRTVYDTTGGASLNWGDSPTGRLLYDNKGTSGLNWQDRFLINSFGENTLDWQNSILYDTSFVRSLDWQNRRLFDSLGNIVIDWQNSVFSGDNWLVNNLTVYDNLYFSGIGTIVDEFGTRVMWPFARALYDTNNTIALEWFDSGHRSLWAEINTTGAKMTLDWQNLTLTGGNWQIQGISSINTGQLTGVFYPLTGNPSGFISAYNLSGSCLFGTSITSGVTQQFINFPMTFGNNPYVILSLGNSSGGSNIGVYASGIVSTGYWAQFSYPINNSGYTLTTLASISTNTGLATTVFVTNNVITTGTLLQITGENLSFSILSGINTNIYTSGSYLIFSGGSVTGFFAQLYQDNLFTGNNTFSGEVNITGANTVNFSAGNYGNGVIVSNTNGSQINWGNGKLYYSTQLSLDWGNQYLLSNISDAPVIEWGDCQAFDLNSNVSFDWTNRVLYNSKGKITIDWQDKILSGNWTGNNGYFTSGLFISGISVSTGNFNSGQLAGAFYPLVGNPSGFISLAAINNVSGGVLFNTNVISGITQQFITFPTIFPTVPIVIASFNQTTGSSFYTVETSGISTSGYWAQYSDTITNSGYIVSTLASTSNGLGNTIINVSGGNFPYSQTGSFIFNTVINSGVTKQFINFPASLGQNPYVITSLNSTGNIEIITQTSGITSMGYWAQFSYPISNTGYILTTLAATSSLTGLATTVIINNTFSGVSGGSGITFQVTGSSNLSAVDLSGIGGTEIILSGNNVLISGGQSINTGILTGSFYPLIGNPSGFITVGQTGLFYPNTNPSGYLYLTPNGLLIGGYNTGIYDNESVQIGIGLNGNNQNVRTTLVGYSAGTVVNGGDATYSTVIGSYAGSNSSGINSATLIGQAAGDNSLNLTQATCLGAYAGYQTKTAQYSVLIGYNCNPKTGDYSVCIGFEAGANSNCNNSILIGNGVGYNNINANNSILLNGNGIGNNNICLGGTSYSGYGTSIGYSSIVSGLHSTAIGYNAQAIGDNVLVLGQNGTNVGIGTSTPMATLDVVGSGNFSTGLYVNHVPVLTSLSINSWQNLIMGTGLNIGLYGNTGITIWNAQYNVIEDKQILAITGSVVLQISGLYNGWGGTLEVIQSGNFVSGTGINGLPSGYNNGSGYNILLPSGTKVIYGGSGQVFLTKYISGAIDVIGLEFDGINLLCGIGNNYN